ncbi:MAG: hypothetical protein AAFO95_19735 [Cyanobacteria bacterium J06600_6]
MTLCNLRDQIIADINSTLMNFENCSEAIWSLRDIDEEYQGVREYIEEIINACATGRVFDLKANKYIV